MANAGTLFEQISELVAQEAEIMNADVGLAMQLFGAPVDDEGKVEEGGKRGFRVITHTTETDSQGTEENESVLSDKELLASAWADVKEGVKQKNVREALSLHIKAELHEKEMELVRKGLALDPVVDEYAQEEVNEEIEELRALNKGCMADITDKEMHANFIERELDESSPELLGFAFDKVGFSRLFDEVEPAYVQNKKEKLEDRNWPHLTAQARKREERFAWLKVKIRNAFDDAMRLKVLGYTVIYREAYQKFNALQFKVHEARDYSFAHRLLDSMVPAMKGKSWQVKRNFYLKLGQYKLGEKVVFGWKDYASHVTAFQNMKARKDLLIKNVYTESRGLTGDTWIKGIIPAETQVLEHGQHSLLMQGWKIMKSKLDAPKG